MADNRARNSGYRESFMQLINVVFYMTDVRATDRKMEWRSNNSRC